MKGRELATSILPSQTTDTFVKFDLDSTQLYVSIDAVLNKIKFNAIIPDNNYFSIGFGSTMTNTDMILW